MPPDERRVRVLIAVSPRAADRLGRILRGHRQEWARSLRELMDAVQGSSFDLVIVGAHFDGSRTIEALKTVRQHAPQAPLVCLRAAPFCNPLGGATLAALHTAAEELGIECFVDLLNFPDDDSGNARVRAMLERLVFVT